MKKLPDKAILKGAIMILLFYFICFKYCDIHRSMWFCMSKVMHKMYLMLQYLQNENIRQRQCKLRGLRGLACVRPFADQEDLVQKASYKH